MGDGSADFCLFGKLNTKGKCKTSSRYREVWRETYWALKVYTCAVVFSAFSSEGKEDVLCDMIKHSHCYSCKLQK